MRLQGVIALALIALNLNAQSNQVDSLGRKQGFWKTEEQRGRRKFSVECYYKDSLLDGTYKRYNRKGELMEETNYKRGMRHGQSNEYWDGKTPLTRLRYYEDLPDGQFEWYDKKGRLIKTIEFNKGKWDGEWKSYLKGKLIAQATFKDDILDGDFVMYYENDVVSFKSIFKDGKMVSGESYYNKDGKLMYIKLPIKTRDRLGSVIYYNRDGTEKGSKHIDELPISHIYFGAGAHKSGELEFNRDEKPPN